MRDIQLCVDPRCPWCGFSPVNIEAEPGFLQPCPSCGKEVLVCSRFEQEDKVCRIWLTTTTGQRVSA